LARGVVEIEVVPQSLHDLIHKIRHEINTTLHKCCDDHPFFGRIKRPDKVAFKVEFGLQTSINHSLFATNGTVQITLDARHLSVCDPGPCGRPRLDKVIYHELGHFIDARIDSAFAYDDAIRPTAHPDELRAMYVMWDSFIDGRLGLKAPYSLQERQKPAKTAALRKLACLAWNGGLKTFPDIVAAAKCATVGTGT